MALLSYHLAQPPEKQPPIYPCKRCRRVEHLMWWNQRSPNQEHGMYVVIFRAKVRQFDAAYTAMAAHMRELALTQFGCLEFQALTEGQDEIALSY